MQQAKPKEGYKLVRFLFNKYEEIPNNWEITKLIELCKEKPQYGAAVAALPKNELLPRYIRITDIKDEGTLGDDWMSINQEEAKPYILSPGDILFARTGATVGKTYLYKEKDGRCAFAGYLIKFKPDYHKLCAEFLFYYTHSYNYRRWLNSFFTQGVQPNVNAEQYSNLMIVRPTIEEQGRITSILSKVDDLIQKTEEIIEQTQRLKKGLMQKLFITGIGHKRFKTVRLFPLYKLEQIPEGWTTAPLRDLVHIIDYRGRTPPFSKEGIIHLRSNNIRNSKIVLDDVVYVSEKTYDEYMTRGIPKEDDVLFTTEGPLGEVAPVPKNFKFSVAQRIIILRPKSGRVLPQFLKYLLMDRRVRTRYLGLSTGSTLEGIATKWFTKLVLPYPTEVSEQKIIHDCLDNVENKINVNQQILSHYWSLRKGMMQKLLTGEIRVKV